jgi:SAM-dependent methyltransferase
LVYLEQRYQAWLGHSLTFIIELQHQIWDICLKGRLSLCPLPEPLRNVLDVGCGTGAWAIDFAKAHPSSRVIGMDLSSIQPGVVPSNVDFMIGDFTASWDFDHKFDYIHSRAITIGVRDWEKLVDEVWRNLEPGGWVEFQEYHLPWTSDDGSISECPKFEQWNQEIFRAAKKAGITPDAIFQVPDLLEKRGFVKTKTASTKWPIGPWAKDAREKRVGEWYLRVSGECR